MSKSSFPTISFSLALVLTFMGVSDLKNNSNPLGTSLWKAGLLALFASFVGMRVQTSRVEQREDERSELLRNLPNPTMAGRIRSFLEAEEVQQFYQDKMRLDASIVFFTLAAIPLLALLFTPADKLGELGPFDKNAISLTGLVSLFAVCTLLNVNNNRQPAMVDTFRGFLQQAGNQGPPHEANVD